MVKSTKLKFCEQFVYLNRLPISFASRPYLPAIYASNTRNLVLRCSRQTEKSTFLVNTILYEACKTPGIQILFVCPRIEQARVFSHSRLMPSLDQSPIPRRILLGKRGRHPQVMNLPFANGSTLFVRAAFHSGDSCRGLSADLLLIDEFQDVAEGDLPVMQETLSHARNGRTILTGTPKSVDNHLESMFQQSTGHEWTIECPECHNGVILNEHCLGPVGTICSLCNVAVDARVGRWVARNPLAAWGDGFWISHPMVPWLNYDEILAKQRTYDLAKLKNEVFGLSTTAGDQIVTRAELEACCSSTPMATAIDQVPLAGRDKLIAGIDWGGGGTSRTVLVIGFMRSDYQFQVCRFERFTATEDTKIILSTLAKRCADFRVHFIAADGGGSGAHLNRLLLDQLEWIGGMYAVLYSMADHEPRQDGRLFRWTVNRTGTIGVVFTRVKSQQIIFPRVEDCGSYLDEFACEFSEYDSASRTTKYSKPASRQDDALHATNYALLVGIRAFNAAAMYE